MSQFGSDPMDLGSGRYQNDGLYDARQGNMSQK